MYKSHMYHHMVLTPGQQTLTLALPSEAITFSSMREHTQLVEYGLWAGYNEMAY